MHAFCIPATILILLPVCLLSTTDSSFCFFCNLVDLRILLKNRRRVDLTDIKIWYNLSVNCFCYVFPFLLISDSDGNGMNLLFLFGRSLSKLGTATIRSRSTSVLITGYHFVCIVKLDWSLSCCLAYSTF